MTAPALAEAVRTGDPDRFAATMAAPPALRPRLWALYALNLDIARAPWASKEPMVAEMRLQWWIDAIGRADGVRADGVRVDGGSAGGVRAGDVRAASDALLVLAPHLAELPDLCPLLLGAAEARRRDAWPEPFDGAADLDAYLDATAGNLMWAAARLLGTPPTGEAVVRDFARGAGIANWLCAVPAMVARGRHPLPDGTNGAVAALAEDGLAAIARARAARASLPASAAPALLTGWKAGALLRIAARDPGRVAQGRLATSEARARASLALRAVTGRW